MHLKGLKIGKLMGKGEKHEEEEADTPTAQKIEEEAFILSSEEEIPVKPHGPLQELSLDSDGDLDDVELEKGLGDDSLSEEELGAVKVVEIEPDTDEMAVAESTGLSTDTLAPEEEPKEEEKPKPVDDSFDSLFANDEEEENLLASLIESLPDVSAQEIINDIAELKEIMREGH